MSAVQMLLMLAFMRWMLHGQTDLEPALSTDHWMMIELLTRQKAL
jgi:hypothetical protein